MDINEKIYRNVKALAQIHGIEMQEVEEQLHKSPGYLSRKSSKISAEMLVNLSRIFEEPIEDLIGGDYERQLQIKNTIIRLRETVEAAREFLSKEAILNTINPLIEEDSEVDDDDNG